MQSKTGGWGRKYCQKRPPFGRGQPKKRHFFFKWTLVLFNFFCKNFSRKRSTCKIVKEDIIHSSRLSAFTTGVVSFLKWSDVQRYLSIYLSVCLSLCPYLSTYLLTPIHIYQLVRLFDYLSINLSRSVHINLICNTENG